ncbi:MAG: hypothetical protein JETCAE02_12630 [Anaerolineaceae bacterium]|jgi:hypothetical protein|nr:hypothetical protein [Anaerolineae bacterium]MBL1171090.1 hypothetical protein [Chloroflexota bacterium]MBV6467375.1 hypothetical protein [Anaerolineales bacterium]MCE7906296.1 hypothetical protein [Anaerolineae bacterium CFX3]MDL1927320.1 hypothetical protein [Anaerolineae bacterium AMX1]GER78714.1 conserved hypothetical protein [Candidatus Denitrolinea symbiosum]GJQ38851.1 MAG: hypothetical protein JETCAE02_12630 [Anaerolineaceae bacterium]
MVKKINNAVVERNARLTSEIIKYILNNPKVLDVLPENFELVLLPENDPELRQLNLDLLDKYGSQGKPIVFARVKANRITARSKPNIFVPIAA